MGEHNDFVPWRMRESCPEIGGKIINIKDPTDGMNLHFGVIFSFSSEEHIYTITKYGIHIDSLLEVCLMVERFRDKEVKGPDERTEVTSLGH